MNTSDAADLIREAVGRSGGAWADLGAGSGTFTRALITLLAPGSHILAVDDDPRAIGALGSIPSVTTLRADFTGQLDVANESLDGFLLANALHFVRDAEAVLSRLVQLLRPGGRVVLVEYDRRAPSLWVPFPIPMSRWPELARACGLIDARITAQRPSQYAGELYATVAFNPSGQGQADRANERRR